MIELIQSRNNGIPAVIVMNGIVSDTTYYEMHALPLDHNLSEYLNQNFYNLGTIYAFGSVKYLRF